MEIKYCNDVIAKEFGFNYDTDVWQAFSIADNFGVEFIQTVYEARFEDYKGKVRPYTELVMALNHKCNLWANPRAISVLGADPIIARRLSDCYTKLYEEAWQKGLDMFEKAWKKHPCLKTDEDLSYYVRTLD